MKPNKKPFYTVRSRSIGHELEISQRQQLLGAADRIVSNRNSTFVIVDFDTIVVTKAASSSGQHDTIPHSFGYAPTLLTFVTITSQNSLQYPTPYIQHVQVSLSSDTYPLLDLKARATADEDNLHFLIDTPEIVLSGNTFGSYEDEVVATFEYYILEKPSILSLL